MQSRRGVVLLMLVMSLSGCAARQKTITNLPAGVTMAQAQDWDAAVAKLHEIASVTSTVRSTVISLNHQGLFPDSNAYATTLTIIGKVDQLQLAASAILKQTPGIFTDSTRAQVKDYLQQISQQLVQLNTEGLTGIKNASNQQKVVALVAEITAAVTLILSL